MLINEEVFDTFPEEAQPGNLPTDVLSLLRDPGLDMPSFITAVLTDYSSDVQERNIRDVINRFPSRGARSESTSLAVAYIDKFQMLLTSTPTLKSKYL